VNAPQNSYDITVFLENYPTGCLIKAISDAQFFENLKDYLSKQHLLSYEISHPYYGKPVEASSSKCQFSGAPVK